MKHLFLFVFVLWRLRFMLVFFASAFFARFIEVTTNFPEHFSVRNFRYILFLVAC